jgi:hypothetical protein
MTRGLSPGQRTHRPYADRVDVDHAAVYEGAVVSPHCAKVALGQLMLPRRRAGHIQVVAIDEAVPDASGGQLNVGLMAQAALAPTQSGRL